MVSKTIDMESSDSDDGDDEQMRKFMEAADITLLTNTMFHQSGKQNPMKENIPAKSDRSVLEQKGPKSNRYLLEEQLEANVDFIATESTQKFLGKKLSELIAKHFEFCNIDTPSKVQKTRRNRVTLLAGADCYVNPYEDFEFETQGPTQRPTIKRRKVDSEEKEQPLEELLNLASVTAEDVTSGKLISGWASKPERKEKHFHYKSDSVGTLHFKPVGNEFTKMRNKNKWNETKIKQTKNLRLA
ncbi:PREDICTED: uncharacterized protein LOC108978465 [Bactrocera latifrons]|uniref:uncharacterized protein LOC108978465 n=1 Tax=Bactrocera latifrons TaxID=174628 RepID=UPI0008DC638A|nr:PREDICTED: uncharacterized protein LOC108978465 [Bactrocera latifrons]